MKKLMAMVLVVLLGVVLLAGCASTGGDASSSPAETAQSSDGGTSAASSESTKAADGAKNIGLIIKNETDPFWIDYIDGLEDACEELGFGYTLFSNQAETDIEDQMELCNTVLSQGFDLLVVSPLDSTAIAPFVLECNKANVPIFIIDTAADDAACAEIGAKSDYFVTGEDYLGGKMAAQMLVDALDGTGEVAILEGMSGSSTATAIQEGIMEIFDQNSGIKVATSETANWSRSDGYDVTTNILAAHPTITGLIAANDEMAQGAIQAIEAAGMTDKIKVVTLNYTQDCIDTMKTGQLYGTVDKGPYRQGYQAITRANDLFNGEQIPEKETVPPLAYLYTDPENASDKYVVEDFQ